MKIYEATEQAYKNGYEAGKPKWISVKERLPELHTKVLCCGIKGGRFIAELGTWGHEKHLYWDKKNGQGCPTVTHWMPLLSHRKEIDNGQADKGCDPSEAIWNVLRQMEGYARASRAEKKPSRRLDKVRILRKAVQA